MNKLSPLHLALALAMALTVSGCELYFGGGGGGGDPWSYCADDGYYVCDGEYCEWAGSDCPDQPGWACESDQDCAFGCYCSSSGLCEEAGFCANDSECADGLHCDEARSSCVPDTCVTDTDCDSGKYCDPATGACSSSCVCTSDAAAQAQGWDHCDEARSSCEPADPNGSCVGTVTCNTTAPGCAEGEVPLILDGCYTGSCQAIAACDVAPTCAALDHENDCLARTGSCRSVYRGINCTNPDGSACQGGSGCTCTDFRFDRCEEPTSSRLVLEPGGRYVDFSSVLEQ